jgi:hypothetical protein
MIRSFATLLRRARGTQALLRRVSRIKVAIRSLSNDRQYEILPGTEYSRYALPVDYPPSRDLQPRWGHTRPVIASIAEWMGRHDDDYRGILAGMSRRAPELARIAREFDVSLLPEPAWCGVPIAPFDSAALYTLIGETKPALYLEIGSGITTAFARRSIRDHGLSTRIISIDPEPRSAIDAVCDEVIRAGLETCDLAVFDRLQPGDILFLDGSHRVFMNSDVTVFMIDVLPRLKPGVLVHIHDITLPWDYYDTLVPWYWSEMYILAAYLIGARDRVKPIFPTSWVCRSPQFAGWFDSPPPVDLGDKNDGWRGGGSLWFTHVRE